MKLVILLLTIACSHAWSNGYSQTITLNLKDASLETVFSEIRKQSPYRFIYTKEDLTGSKMVNIHLKAVPINEVMEKCLADQPLTYQIEGKHIIIKKRKFELSGIDEKPMIALIDVTGEVLNEEGEAVVGASVQVKGNENKGTSTDANGLFILRHIDDKEILIISSTNIETHEIKVNGKSNLGIITVKTRVSKLDEIQVIGYGTNTQRYNVGSVTKITAEEIAKQPVSNPLAALQGRVPGLEVTSTSGLPGSSINIQIRGQNTINPNPTQSTKPKDAPFFIVDGVPFAPQNNNINQFRSLASPGISGNHNNPYGGISPFNSINPSDIESIEILRDADATAIYGSRGANGVILITTKKGKKGKTSFNANLITGFSKAIQNVKYLDTKQYLALRNEAFINDGVVPSPVPGNAGYAPDLTIFDTMKYTNWSNYFSGRTGNSISVNTTISGGSENTQFLIGANYHREDYIYPGDFYFNQASVNMNLSHISANKKFLLSTSTNYSFNKNNSSGEPNFLLANVLPPNYPDLLDSEGNLIWDYKGISLGSLGIIANPLSYIKKKYTISNNNLISNLQFNYKILPSLTFRTNLGFNSLYSDEYSGNPASSQDPNKTRIASASFGSNIYKTWILEPQIEYIQELSKGKINLLLGSTFQNTSNSLTQIFASGYNNDGLIESISGAPNKFVNDVNSQYRYTAFFGRLNYILKSKYILNISGRKDGSSRFGPSNRFGQFGSIGAGWIFTEEKFSKENLAFINYGKIRASYGSSGSDNIGDYQYISRWAPTEYSYQGIIGLNPQNLFNSEFGWAKTNKMEFGLELGFHKNNIITNISYYNHRTGNQLVSYPLPTQTGFNSVTENLNALVSNSGIELQVSTLNIRNKNFEWNSSFNLTIPNNKLISFPFIENSSYATKYMVGESLNALIGLKYAGVNDSTGIFEFLTKTHTLTYEPTRLSGSDFGDYVVLGNLEPKYYGGLLNNLKFRSMELTIFLEFKNQIGQNFLGQIYKQFLPGLSYNLPNSVLTRWQNINDISEFQKVSMKTNSIPSRTATRYFTNSSGAYSNASYIRLKTLSLSYTIPKNIATKLRVTNLKVYASAQNLYTVTNYQAGDPETQSLFSNPIKTMVAGINLSF